jgi:hypothetical protein
MPGVQLDFVPVEGEGEKRWLRAAAGALVCSITSFAASGCAREVAQYQPTLFMDGGASVVAEATKPDDTAASTTGASPSAVMDWTHRTYVYRGGRDPKTGLARTQL